MRDGFVFYRSFFESFSDLSKKDKLLLFDALCNYALNDVEPDLIGVPAAIFKLLKPQVDANNRRFENGKKGGRPRQNQTETKTEPNDNQAETKTEPKVQVQVQVKDKVKDKDKVQEKEKVKDKDNVQPQPQDKGPGSGLCGGGADDDGLSIYKLLGADGIDKIYDAYPNSGGFLLDEVAHIVKASPRKINNAVGYVLGYAKKVKWDDNADHFIPPWEA